VPYLSASAVVNHYKEALYQMYAPLPLPFIEALGDVSLRQSLWARPEYDLAMPAASRNDKFLLIIHLYARWSGSPTEFNRLLLVTHSAFPKKNSGLDIRQFRWTEPPPLPTAQIQDSIFFTNFKSSWNSRTFTSYINCQFKINS